MVTYDQGGDSDAWLLQRAADFVDGLRAAGHPLLPYPVSRIQREFRLGYTRACALVDALVRRGEWTIEFAPDGTRFARLHPKRGA